AFLEEELDRLDRFHLAGILWPKTSADRMATLVSVALRRIVHVDMDAFYASVEQRDDPTLRGKPIAVGGDASGRGVVCAASYEARKFGVRSAIPMSRAVRLCPSLVVVRPDFEKYMAASETVFGIFREVADK